MISWFTKNDVAANLLLIAIALLGIYSLKFLIPLEFFPSFEARVISVNVSLRGATPEDSELGLALRIEEAIKEIEGIEEYSSRSVEGGSTVTIEVDQDYDPRSVLDDVKNRVDAINTFPVEAEKPVISLAQNLRSAITVTLSADVSEREMRELGEQLREDIVQLPEVSQAELEGVRDYEVAIELNEDKLREYNLSLQTVSRAISNSSLDISGGNIFSSAGDILIRSKGQAYYQDQFENIVLLTRNNGTILRLGDIATVNDGFEEKPIRTRFNGKAAASVEVYSVGDQSIIKVVDAVKAYVEKRQAEGADGVELTLWRDRSDIIKKRINTLTKNALQGGILVILLLSLFLRPGVAFWVFLGIPISFCGAWFVMPFLGVSLNMISLFAFIIVLGIVVDDAIVTGENVYTHLQHSESGIDAAINGTKEVAVPVTFGVLTTVVAFLPLGFMEGARGQIFAQIPAIVIPVLLFSLIESKFILPAHLKHVRITKNDNPNKIQRFQRNFAIGFERAILKYYQPLLAFCLRHKFSTVCFFFGLLAIILATIFAGHTKFIFFPRVPSESVRINLTMPTGTSFEVTEKHMQRIQQSAIALQEKYIDPETNESVIDNILTRIGGRGGQAHRGNARIQLTSPEDRSIKVTSTQLAREWRQLIGPIPGAEQITFRAEIGRAGDPIDIQLRADDLNTLEILANEVQQQLASYTGVFDINDSLSQGKEEINLELTPEAHILGLTRSSVLSQVRQSFFGLEAQRIQRGRNDVRVMIRLPRSERSSISDLESLLITTPQGQPVPLAQVAILTPSISPTVIYRIDGKRTASVRADIEKERVNMTALSADLNPFLDQLVSRYPGASYKLGGEQEEQAESLGSLLFGLVGLLFAIYCLLAIPFKSYIQPVVVMSVIPFGIIGAIIGHWLMGMSLTIMSLMGILALLGVLVNDSLVLVDYLNKVRREGTALSDAVLKAGAARFRPVMLTSLTTFFGLMPLLFEKETQAQFLIPMAVSLGFGILFATFITLLMVPVNYYLLERLKIKLGGQSGSLRTDTV